MSKDNIYYVYLHRRGDNNEVFYVGKGKGNRSNHIAGRNSHWTAIYNKHGRIVEYVEKDLPEDDAYDLEMELIKFYREAGHELANVLPGGRINMSDLPTEPNTWDIPPVSSLPLKDYTTHQEYSDRSTFTLYQSNRKSAKTRLNRLRISVNGVCIVHFEDKQPFLVDYLKNNPDSWQGKEVISQMEAQGFGEYDYDKLFRGNLNTCSSSSCVAPA